MAYLQRLQARGEGLEHSNKLLQLLADCDRPSLLPFLRKNEHYMLDIALEVCKQRSFTEEVIFLLGKSGNRLSALELIIISLGKIDMAIDFCSEHDDDPELWQRLVDLAMTRSEYISRLLAMAGTFVDPLGLIEKAHYLLYIVISNIYRLTIDTTRALDSIRNEDTPSQKMPPKSASRLQITYQTTKTISRCLSK